MSSEGALPVVQMFLQAVSWNAMGIRIALAIMMGTELTALLQLEAKSMELLPELKSGQ